MSSLSGLKRTTFAVAIATYYPRRFCKDKTLLSAGKICAHPKIIVILSCFFVLFVYFVFKITWSSVTLASISR